MNIFGIGPLEAFFFVVIMLIILGPTDMVKLGRTLGTNLRKLWTSPTWRMIFSTSNTLRNLPNALAREAGMEELRQELQRETDTIKKMGKEITEAAQINIPKFPAPGNSTPGIEEGDFSAWTTPIENTPSPGIDNTNSILPPHLGKSNPSRTGEETRRSDEPPSQTEA
jgi:hypothetical protein